MLNSAIQNLGVYASRAIARNVEQDARVISLSIGEPDFGPPPSVAAILAALAEPSALARDLKRYERSLGARSLREAIATYYQRYFSLAINPDDQVLVTHGGVGALTSAILATTSPGDEVLVGDPSYMLYERLVVVLGRVPRAIPRHPSDGYRFDSRRVRQALTRTTAAMIVNSPENPTGYVCPDGELKELADICASNDITLIHDEVYDQFNFQGHHPAGLLSGFSNVVQINSMSKKFGVPGLRLGWMISSAETVAVAARAQDYVCLAINSFIERLAESLLRCEEQVGWFRETREMLSRRIAEVTERLGAIEGVTFPSRVFGGMFVFPTVAGLAVRKGLAETRSSGEAVADWLLREASVAVVPGAVYGPLGADSIRIVVCGPENDLDEAIHRIAVAAR